MDNDNTDTEIQVKYYEFAQDSIKAETEITIKGAKQKISVYGKTETEALEALYEQIKAQVVVLPYKQQAVDLVTLSQEIEAKKEK